jgi:hypothetical protein
MLIGPRIGRPGLLGLAARTAVVAGTAGAVSGAMQRRAESREQEEADATAYQQQQAAAAAPPSASGAGGDAIGQLERLAALRQQGILTDQEFAAEKAKILAG